MKKFKNILAGLFAAVTVVSCVAVPASAGDFNLRKGQEVAVTSVIGAPGVTLYCKCDSSSSYGVTCTLRRAATGITMVTEKSYTVKVGGSILENYNPGNLPDTTMWQCRVDTIAGKNTAASGYCEAYFGK